MHKSGRRILYLVLILSGVLAVLLFLRSRIYHVEFSAQVFTESTNPLPALERGFYSVQGFTIDPFPQDFVVEQPEGLPQTDMMKLVQINLRKFRTGEINKTGLENIRELFRRTAAIYPRFIVRFLYDWNGEAEKFEPDDFGVVQTHVEQLLPILETFSDHIFVIQGTLLGKWGEMHGTRFPQKEHMTSVLEQLLSLQTDGVFLSVRTPVQWRVYSGLSDLSKLPDDCGAARIGLFNDAMMGSWTDCGTYGADEVSSDELEAAWNRTSELAFQNELCRLVPNGGEVILESDINDFENAVDYFRTTHVSYLNWMYDREVLDKWARNIVKEPGCFNGMDGLTYIERHLGYRYGIQAPVLSYSVWKNQFTLGADLFNHGFAPIYQDTELTVTLCGHNETLFFPVDVQLRTLAGGTDSASVMHAAVQVQPSQLHETEYDLYITAMVPSYDSFLQFANQESALENGYYLGRFSFETSGEVLNNLFYQ